MARHNIRTDIICPKCKSKDIKLLEVSEEYRVWRQDEDGKIGPEQEPEYGDLIGVRAICQAEGCKHRWTVRGITEITELPNWPSAEGEGEAEAVAEPVVVAVVEPEPPTPAVEATGAKKRGKKKAA